MSGQTNYIKIARGPMSLLATAVLSVMAVAVGVAVLPDPVPKPREHTRKLGELYAKMELTLPPLTQAEEKIVTDARPLLQKIIDANHAHQLINDDQAKFFRACINNPRSAIFFRHQNANDMKDTLLEVLHFTIMINQLMQNSEEGSNVIVLNFNDMTPTQGAYSRAFNKHDNNSIYLPKRLYYSYDLYKFALEQNKKQPGFITEQQKICMESALERFNLMNSIALEELIEALVLKNCQINSSELETLLRYANKLPFANKLVCEEFNNALGALVEKSLGDSSAREKLFEQHTQRSLRPIDMLHKQGCLAVSK